MQTLSLSANAPTIRFFSKSVLSFIFIVFGLGILSASNKVDSLHQLAKEALNAEESYLLYHQIFTEFQKTNDSRIPQFAEELLAISERGNYDKGKAFSYYISGNYNLAIGKHEEAVSYFKQARHFYDIVGHHENYIASTTNLGITYERMGQSDMVKKSYDEALAKAEKVGDDKLLAAAYQRQGEYWGNKGETKKAFSYLDKAIEIRKKLGDEINLAMVYFSKGRVLAYTEPAKSLEILKKAETIALKKERYDLLNYVRQSLVYVYYKQGRFPEAIDVVSENLVLAESMNNSAIVINSYNNLGDLYRSLFDTEQSIKHYAMALQKAEEIEFYDFVMVSLSNLGILYREKEDYTKATTYLERGLFMSDSLKNYRPKLEILVELGKCYLGMQKIEKAGECFRKALELNNEEIPTNTHRAYAGLGNYFLKKKNYSKAKKYLLQAYNYGEQNAEFHTTKEAALGLSQVAKAINNYPEALKWAEKYLVLTDSINVTENRDKITALRVSSKFEKDNVLLAAEEEKQKALLEAKAERNLLASFGFGALALLALGFFYNARRKNKIIAKANNQLESLNHTKDRIFAIIGHDLRKPAIGFRGISKVINYLLDNKDYDRLQKVGTEVERDALSLYKLTDNLLSWALMQKDVMPYNPSQVSAAEIAEETMTVFQRVASDKNITLISNIPADLTVFADPNALATIVRNLTDNALKYTPKGGSVTLNAVESDAGVKIIIEDTGIGIANDKINDIFLLQKDKSERGTAGEKGTGIGLHLIHELVKLNQGEVEVESALGEGTKVVVMLPKRELAAA